MAVIVKSLNDVGAGDQITPAAGDTIIVEEGITVYGTGTGADGMAGFDSDVLVYVNGVLGGDDNAIEIGANSIVNVGINGALLSRGTSGLSEDSGAVAVNGDASTLDNRGTISAEERGVELQSLATDFILLNSGSITSADVGVSIEALRAAVTNSGDMSAINDVIESSFAADIDNAGTMTSSQARVMEFAVGSVDVVNTGLINSHAEAIYIDGGFNSIVNDGVITSDVNDAIAITADGGSSITNNNKIQAEDDGIRIGGADNSIVNTGEIVSRSEDGIQVVSGGRTSIVNTGVVSAESEGINMSGSGYTITNHGTVISLDDDAVQMNITDAGGTGTLVNHGTITSLDGVSAAVLGDGSSQDFDKVFNSGTINGNVDLNNGNDLLQNSGLIDGDVLLEGGADTYDGRGGTVTGTVAGGLGDDTYIVDDAVVALVENASEGTDTVQAEANYALEDNFENLTLIGAGNIDGTGNDTQNTITGNAGANVINGLGSRDTINAGGGNDTVDAGRGNDTVEGGDGDDSIVGRAGNDILNGGEGSDFIFGGLGNDVIDGGNGDDRLKGGLGADTLTGGSGADTFLFCRTDESTTAAFDRVTDFDAGLDVLDLSGMTDAPLTFSSAGAIGGGTASVFLSVTGGGNTNVFVDVDGDGTADARVLLQGSTGVTEADFIF